MKNIDENKLEKAIREYLNKFNKERLLYVAGNHELNVSKKMKKGEIIDRLSEILFERFILDTHSLFTYELNFFIKLLMAHYPEIFPTEKKDFFNSLPIFVNREMKEEHGLLFFNRGYIHFYVNDKGEQFVSAQPHLVNYLLENFSDIASESILNDVLLYFLTGLINLYGCLSVAQFQHMWNKSNEEIVTEEKIKQFCDHMEKLEYPFRCEEGYIVHEALNTEDFKELLEMVANKPYYTPTMEEISAYAIGPIDKTAAVYQKMTGYLRKNPGGLSGEKLDSLIENVAYGLKYNSSFINIMKIFELMAYKFKDETAVNELHEILQHAMNNTRKWVNRGFTPHELYMLFGR